MSKLFLLIICLHVQCMTMDAQTSVFADQVLLFSCDSNNDTTLMECGTYYYVDSYGFIHRIGVPFRYAFYGYDVLTTKLSDSTYREETISFLQPHEINRIYRYRKIGSNIWCDEIAEMTEKKRSYLNFNLEGKSYRYNDIDSNFIISSTLIDTDSVIVFNLRKFHCWVFDEFTTNIKGRSFFEYKRVFIDKSTLLPVQMEYYSTDENAEIKHKFESNKKVSVLLGILEINREMIDGLHIWGKKPLESRKKGRAKKLEVSE